jgi:hypothetical protein
MLISSSLDQFEKLPYVIVTCSIELLCHGRNQQALFELMLAGQVLCSPIGQINHMMRAKLANQLPQPILSICATGIR